MLCQPVSDVIYLCFRGHLEQGARVSFLFSLFPLALRAAGVLDKYCASIFLSECRSFVMEMAPKSHDSTQHTDISVNEILIPAKTDPTAVIDFGGDVSGINPENTVISLGEAVCFQYMNSSDRLPVVGEQNETSEGQASAALVSKLQINTK